MLLGIKSLSGQSEKELTIEFMKIDSLQYIKFRKDYSSYLIVDSIKKTTADSSFSLNVNNESRRFDCKRDFSGCYYYKGFLPPLNSFVITHCSTLICETFLIDKASGERQNLFSPYDNESETPVLSKDLTKMLVFASDVFGRASFISIYQRSTNKGNFDFKSFASLNTNKWKVFEVVWINDTSIALKTFDQYGGKTGNELLNVKYLKGEIKY